MTKSRRLLEEIDQEWKARNLDRTSDLLDSLEILIKAEDPKWLQSNLKHAVRTYKGLVCLEQGQIEQAKHYLLKSLDFASSPQIHSFGPNFLLAEKLIEVGETTAVLDYLDHVKGVWSLIFRWRKLRRWRKEIIHGIKPKFGANLYYHLGAKLT